ncbi:MAG: MCE family protein [Gemmatimonadetes bacterium]|nr:MCE family protein [Gemmatimonadota bacterium]
MKWEPADLRVGLLLIGATAVGVGSFVWLSPAVTDNSIQYYADFPSVEGLDEQSKVSVRGFQIGRVSDILATTAEDGTIQFRVRMKINPSLSGGRPLRIPKGTVALLRPPALLGTADISLEIPSRQTDPLPPGSVLKGAIGQALTDQLKELATGVGEDTRKTLKSATRLIDSLTTVASQVRSAAVVATDLLNTGKTELPTILANVNKDLNGVDSLVHEFKTLSPALKVSLDSVNRLVSDTRRTINQVSSMAKDREPEIGRIAANLDSTAVLLRSFVEQVARRPMRAITGVTIPVIAPREPPPPAKAAVAPAAGTATSAATSPAGPPPAATVPSAQATPVKPPSR